MRIVVADYETRFSSVDYTLSKMSTEAYVRDPRFEIHGVAVKAFPDQPAVWYDRDQWPAIAAQTDWSDVFLIHHHAQFDGLINSHHFNMHPRAYGCTLSMARLMLGNHLSVSLEAVRKHYGIPSKTTPYHLFDGKRWDDLSPASRQQIAAGACDEVDSIYAIFNRLMTDGFPLEELEVVDATIKMFTEPVMGADTDLLAKVWESEATKKQERMAALNVTEADLQSADRFAQLLRDEGMEPETKEGKNGAIYAFAKTDQFMRDLCEHDNERVRTLAEARLGAKSTLMQTRAETLGWMASRGPMPVYLRYCGAHTTRWSGGDGANWQNFRRGSDIRKAIMAPDGYLLAPIDLSQIECRLLNYLAGQEDVVEKFRRGEDPYIGIASQAYGFQVTKANVTERGTGKQLELSCLGPDTLVLTSNGTKAITKVQLSDWLWDGEEWVQHSGLLPRGEKFTIQATAGLQVTPDHLVLCGSTWREARSLQNEKYLSQALARGSENLPFPATRLADVVASLRYWFAARAARMNTRLTRVTCIAGAPRAAMFARKKHRDIGRKNITATLIFAPTTRIVVDSLAALGRFIHAALHPLLGNGVPMVGAASAYIPHGPRASLGAALFSHTFSRCGVGTIPLSTWIEKIMREAMYRGIYALSHGKKTASIDGLLQNSKKKLPTYDIACSGPRNRFTIVTPAGPIIVHNCGYQAGAQTIQSTARLGIYGPPVHIDIATATRWRDLYRSTHPAVVDYWKTAGRMIARIAGGDPMPWGPMLVKDKKIFGPGGTFLNYTTLDFKPADDEDIARGDRDGYWRIKTRNGWSKLYSGRLVENVVQWLARIVMSQAMLRIIRLGYRVVNTTHDELLVLIPKDGNEQRHLEVCMAEMKRTPDWLPGIPLDCEGSLGERYSK